MEANEQPTDLMKTARLTGVWYLILAITGMSGFLVFHPQIFIAEDPGQTLNNLIEQESFARVTGNSA